MINNTSTILSDDKIIEEEAKKYLTYKIAIFTHKYWFPVPLCGILGNFLSLCVLLKPNNRRLSTCMYMSAIAINDNLMLSLALWNVLVVTPGIIRWTIWPCRIMGYMTLAAYQQGTYQVRMWGTFH